ncbi:hypothetical protein [Rudaea sp.]|uniref:hypothetical protein n=1 Tax=Rudaea sp. TaxID=2136325 RepID=UPI002ED4AE19
MIRVYRYVLVLLATICVQTVHADDAKIQSIFDHMAKLSALGGKWRAQVDYHDRNGKVSKRNAEYVIRPTLDNTYLEADVAIWPIEDPSKRHGFMIMTTYNPDTHRYDQTYFYTRWAIRVTETGEFDDAAHEYRTTAFIPREDGVRDESVRTTTKFRNDGTVEYWHWSRYDNENTELMNFHAVLQRTD